VKCVKCAAGTIRRKATLESPYRFVQSGLENVYLVGITVEKCPHCGSEYPIIPRVEDLHKAIAAELARKKTLLSGDEIRFLRKIAGFPANTFASLLRIDPSTLSRAENERQTLGHSSDKLARAVAMAAINEASVKEILIRAADKLARPRRSRLPIFRYRAGWRAAA